MAEDRDRYIEHYRIMRDPEVSEDDRDSAVQVVDGIETRLCPDEGSTSDEILAWRREAIASS